MKETVQSKRLFIFIGYQKPRSIVNLLKVSIQIKLTPNRVNEDKPVAAQLPLETWRS